MPRPTCRATTVTAAAATPCARCRIALFLILIINTWLNTIFYAILIIVIGSWLQTDPRQPVMQIALACADWLMAPLRRIIPPVGMIDFTPMAALFILYLAQSGINRLLLGGLIG